jgi:hypothetical protein
MPTSPLVGQRIAQRDLQLGDIVNFEFLPPGAPFGFGKVIRIDESMVTIARPYMSPMDGTLHVGIELVHVYRNSSTTIKLADRWVEPE